MKTGNTGLSDAAASNGNIASMEPGHEDREYLLRRRSCCGPSEASMEPGHEDREYSPPMCESESFQNVPQWSPVMKTGNT